MPRLIGVVLAAVLGISTPASDVAWLFLVDDLHVSFVHTGRLRDLLRTGARELIHDGDRWLLRASGPSGSASADPESIAAAIKVMTGNGLKASDIAAAPSEELVYRTTVALDAAEAALDILAAEADSRKAMVLVSWGYDVDGSPAVADRVTGLARRARESGITIFAIDARGFPTDLEAGSPADPVMWESYLASARRSLSLMTEETGGFVIERASEALLELKRVAVHMRR